MYLYYIGPIALVYPRHFLLTYLYQARNMSGHAYMCVRGIDFTFFGDFRQCVFAFFHFDNNTNYVKLNFLFATLPYNLYFTAVYVNKRYRSSLYINMLTRN
jgi:hypothetical protein